MIWKHFHWWHLRFSWQMVRHFTLHRYLSQPKTQLSLQVLLVSYACSNPCLWNSSLEHMLRTLFLFDVILLEFHNYLIYLIIDSILWIWINHSSDFHSMYKFDLYSPVPLFSMRAKSGPSTSALHTFSLNLVKDSPTAS